jgi:hypothetical protein
MTRLFILFSFFLIASNSFSQLIPSNGVAESKANYYALQHVNVYVSAYEFIENATVLIKGNKMLLSLVFSLSQRLVNLL